MRGRAKRSGKKLEVNEEEGNLANMPFTVSRYPSGEEEEEDEKREEMSAHNSTRAAVLRSFNFASFYFSGDV